MSAYREIGMSAVNRPAMRPLARRPAGHLLDEMASVGVDNEHAMAPSTHWVANVKVIRLGEIE